MARFIQRYVHPRDLQPGDRVYFTLPESGGITSSYDGRVRNRGVQGRTLYWKTNEGSRIVSWDAEDTKTRVLLLDREPAPQSLLEMDFTV